MRVFPQGAALRMRDIAHWSRISNLWLSSAGGRARRGLVLSAILAVFATTAGYAQDAGSLFERSCSGCHTIGGEGGLGPDLKNVTQRRSREWLVKFMLDPQAMIDSGDPYAAQILKDASGFVMPKSKTLDRAGAEALLNFIEGKSNELSAVVAGNRDQNHDEKRQRKRDEKREEVRDKERGGERGEEGEETREARHATEEPFTAEDVGRGRQIVLGERSLVRGGPACIACHTLRDLSSLGGGRLGPDLTAVYQRLGGGRSLTAWLSAPPTPAMQIVYKDHPLEPQEILPLVAYFESTSKLGGGANPNAVLYVFLIGLGGSLVGLVILDSLWRKRFNTVRRALVNRSGGKKS